MEKIKFVSKLDKLNESLMLAEAHLLELRREVALASRITDLAMQEEGVMRVITPETRYSRYR